MENSYKTYKDKKTLSGLQNAHVQQESQLSDLYIFILDMVEKSSAET